MHGATLLDGADTVLRPAILWNDGRASAECAEIEAACPDARKIAGNIAMAGFTAPKLLWVKKHEPKNFDAVRKVLLPKDYVRLLLTGEYASDMSDASGTYWLDVGKRDWSDALLTATSLTARPYAALGRRLGGFRNIEGRSRATLGHEQAAGRGGRRWRQRGLGLRHRRGQAGCRFRVARHLGRAVRLEREILAQHRRRGACLLPRCAQYLAPDGRDPVGDRQSQLAFARAGRTGARAHQCAGPPSRRSVFAVLPALSLGRTDADQQSGCARRVPRHRSRDRPQGDDPGGAGRRGLCLPRLPARAA